MEDDSLSSVGDAFAPEIVDSVVPDVENISGKKRKSITSGGVTPKTIYRWKMTGAVSVDQLLGYTPGAREDHTALAEELLNKTGLVVCSVCSVVVSANKKSVRRHQVKNRHHLTCLHEKGSLIDESALVKAVLVATNLLSPNPQAMSTLNLEAHTNSVSTYASASFNANAALPVPATRPVQSRRISPALSAEAWDIISFPEKVVQTKELAELLGDLGVHEGKDLFFCELSELKSIANTLKKVPQRRFLQIFGLAAAEESSLLDLHNMHYSSEV